MIRALARDIRLEHSVFALPFAYLGMILAARGLPTVAQIIWITVAMVSARTLAMAANRLIDRRLDAINPRTAGRALPKGRLTPAQVVAACVISFGLFLFSAAQLNALCLALAPVAAVIVVGYSYTKRYTWLSHIVLGIADAIAPVGGWIAVAGAFDLQAILLGLTVMAWIAGFDVIYSCQDLDFDLANGLHSAPVQFGIPVALTISSALHIATVTLLAVLGPIAGLGVAYYVGVVAAAGLLYYEHSLVSADDLSRLGIAFFNVNGYIAVAVFGFTFAGLYV
jgi:4-hydroxybenzoate polyprenyltransferase